MSFKLKMKLLLFLVSSVISFSASVQNENFHENVNDTVNIQENYLISAAKRNNKKNSENLEENEKVDDNDKTDVADENADVSKSNESLKYSQRNDGIIDLNSLVHKEDTEFRVLNGNNVKIMLRTKNNDVYSAEVVYDGGKKLMRGIGNYGGNEIFMAEIPSSVSSYYFVLTDDKTKYYMGRNISKNLKDIERFEFSRSNKLTTIPEWARGSVEYQLYID